MKKLLLGMLAMAATCSMANAAEVTLDFTGTGNVYGLERTSDNNASYYQTGTTLTGTDNVTVGILGSGDSNAEYGNGARLWSDGLRIMKKSGLTISCSDNITSIVVTTTKNNGPASFDVNSTESFTLTADNAKEGTWTGGATTVTLINNATKGLKGTVCITKMVITTGGQADTRKDAGLSFPADKYEATLGEAFTAPALTKATTATVTYASDKETVATVDPATGTVTLVGEGVARITASAPANDEYKAGQASYLLTVKAPVEIPEGTIFFSELGEDFTFENPTDAEVWKHDSKYGLKGSAFISKKCVAATAYAVSPVIDLTGKKNITLNFKNAFNQYKLNNVLIDVADFEGYAYVVAREEGATEWTTVAEATAPASFTWNFFDNQPVSLERFAGKKIQIAFKYISTAEIAGTWEVQGISVAAENSQSGIVEIEAAEGAVEYYNLQGVRVENPSNGLYIRKQGNQVTKVIVK